MKGGKGARDKVTEEEREGGSGMGKGAFICAGPSFVVTPLLIGPVYVYLARAGLKSQSAPVI